MNRWCTVFIWIVSAQWLGALVMSADLYGYNGERDEALSNYLNDLSEKRSWQSLNGPWGKRASDLKGSGEISEYDRVGSFQEPNYVQLSDSGAVDGALDAKRSWKSMNAAWGKRIGDWNKFRGERRQHLIYFLLHAILNPF